jgi:8-oxo-dGTP pyrophosphatase MutT (NUDIX family)
MWASWSERYELPVIGGLQPAPDQWSEATPPRASAVLCLFIPPAAPSREVRVLFTQRSALVRTHRGQIGFPGGRRETPDKSPIATALRESQEEVGLSPGQVTILGSLPPLKALDLHPVIPIVGCAAIELEELTPNNDEVAAIFALPWSSLTAQARQNIRFNVFGRWRETAVYAAGPYPIWGLTAMMLGRAQFHAGDEGH